MARCRTYRYRLHPTVKQTRALTRQLDYQHELYNAALEERIGAWQWERRSVSLFEQYKTLTGLVEVRPEVVVCGITLCRGTLMRLDRAFAGFFRRTKMGEAPGFPRFRSAQRFDSLQWEAYKAESAGRTIVAVNPHYTSQTCFECGHVEPGNRLSQAEFRCCSCGHEDHADINAAHNILRAGS
jgi:transposase